MTKVWTFPDGTAWSGESIEDAVRELNEREGRRVYRAAGATCREIKDMDDFEREFGTSRQRASRTESGVAEWLETYGKDLKKILKLFNSKDVQVKQTVWTVVEGDDGLMYLIAGYHYVNRTSYVISKKPWKTGQEEFLW